MQRSRQEGSSNHGGFDGLIIRRAKIGNEAWQGQQGTRIPIYNSFPICYIYLARGCSSVGRARQSHCRGQGFEPPHLHLVLYHRKDKKPDQEVLIQIGDRRDRGGVGWGGALYGCPWQPTTDWWEKPDQDWSLQIANTCGIVYFTINRRRSAMNRSSRSLSCRE